MEVTVCVSLEGGTFKQPLISYVAQWVPFYPEFSAAAESGGCCVT